MQKKKRRKNHPNNNKLDRKVEKSRNFQSIFIEVKIDLRVFIFI